jgi:hypothetical protein
VRHTSIAIVLPVAVALALHANGSSAESLPDGETLQRLCAAQEDTIEDMQCSGHIIAFYAGWQKHQRETGERPPFCTPKPPATGTVTGSTTMHVEAEVRKHLSGHPELRHKNYLFLLEKAFEEAFPCP